MKRFLVWTIGTFFLVMLGLGMAQFPKLKIKIPKKIPGLNKILKSKPPLTTNIADAVTEVPFLDDFDPNIAWPMSVLPRTSAGGFILEYPGNYMFECQSYCLRAGTYAPGEGRSGRGYLYAPLKGPQADIVSNVLKKSYQFPEIPQKKNSDAAVGDHFPHQNQEHVPETKICCRQTSHHQGNIPSQWRCFGIDPPKIFDQSL